MLLLENKSSDESSTKMGPALVHSQIMLRPGTKKLCSMVPICVSSQAISGPKI